MTFYYPGAAPSVDICISQWFHSELLCYYTSAMECIAVRMGGDIHCMRTWSAALPQKGKNCSVCPKRVLEWLLYFYCHNIQQRRVSPKHPLRLGLWKFTSTLFSSLSSTFVEIVFLFHVSSRFVFASSSSLTGLETTLKFLSQDENGDAK